MLLNLIWTVEHHVVQIQGGSLLFEVINVVHDKFLSHSKVNDT